MTVLMKALPALPGLGRKASSGGQQFKVRPGAGVEGKLPLSLQFYPSKADVPASHAPLDGGRWDARLYRVDLRLDDQVLLPSLGPGMAIAASTSNPVNGPGEFSPDGRFFVLNDSSSSSSTKIKVLDMIDAGNVQVRASVTPTEIGSNGAASVTINSAGVIVIAGNATGNGLVGYIFNEETNALTKVSFPSLSSELGATSGFTCVRFSPSGQYLAISYGTGVGIYRFNGASFNFVAKIGTTAYAQVDWLSENELAATEGFVVRRLLFNGTALSISTAWTMQGGHYRFLSPDRQHFYSVVSSGGVAVYMYRIGDGVVTALLSGKSVAPSMCRALYLSPDAKELIVIGQYALGGGGYGDSFALRLNIATGATIAGTSVLDGMLPRDSYGVAIRQGTGNSVALIGYRDFFVLRPPKPCIQNSAGVAAVKVA